MLDKSDRVRQAFTLCRLHHACLAAFLPGNGGDDSDEWDFESFIASVPRLPD
jgi:hypothetical protein